MHRLDTILNTLSLDFQEYSLLLAKDTLYYLN